MQITHIKSFDRYRKRQTIFVHPSPQCYPRVPAIAWWHGCPARQPVQNGQKIKYITSTSYIPNRRTIYVTGVSHWLWSTFLLHYYLKTRSRRFMAEILPIRRNTLFQSINHIWKWHFSDQTHTYALYICLHFPLHLGIMILLYDEFMENKHHYSAKQEWFVQR